MTVVSHFVASWADVHGIEGAAFTNDPGDSGGATQHGVTEAVARAHGYIGPMDLLPAERARAIAKTQYWDALNLDAVAALSPRIAHEVFECGFNCGLDTAGTFLQRCLNVLNRSDLPSGPHWPDLVLDGHVGALTIRALKAFLAQRGAGGEFLLLKMLNALQGARYIVLAERRTKDEKFVYGWFNRRVDIPST